jgi:hypothetical protein
MDIQPMHVGLLGAIFCTVVFWVGLIVGVIALFRRRR